jgi:hypothetical protein
MIKEYNQQEHPVIYRGWIIKQRKDNKMFYAFDFRNNKYINPLFKDWTTLKKFINAMN